MNFEIVNSGARKKVAFFSKQTFGGLFDDPANVLGIAKYCDIEAHVFDTNEQRFHNFSNYESHLHLDEDASMKENYLYIINYVKSNNIETCLFLGSGFPWANSFLKELKSYSYVACYFSDDPEGSENTSRYYVRNFQYAFCAGVYFDKKSTIEDKYKEWGAIKSKFVPLGANSSKYHKVLNNLDRRKYDLVYVGGCYFPKVIRMFRLKRHFGNRMLMYGRGWNESNSLLKTLILKSLKFFYRIPIIEELPKDKLIDLYQNTKIGFNIHMSYGPSNQRMYELPMNGVMQLCDCVDGLSKLYEVNKEVVSYKNISDAINKIEYYLQNDIARQKISRAGYDRAMKYYKAEDSFLEIFIEIDKELNKIYGIK